MTSISNTPNVTSGNANLNGMSGTPKIAILDAGSQYGKLIDRRVRELLVETVILPLEVPATTIRENNIKGIIVSGSPSSCVNAETIEYDPDIFKLGIPVLGICYGMQIINKFYGGSIETKSVREDGQHDIEIENTCPLFKHLSRTQKVLLTHGDSIEKLGLKLKVAALSINRIIAALYNEQEQVYGVQFHPEVDLTINGKQMLSNFIFEICKMAPSFTMQTRKDECIKEIKERVGTKTVLLLCSGGVDSTVCAALLRLALPPNQIIALHIDNGFMRKNESEAVEKALSDIGIQIKVKKAFYNFFKGSTTYRMPGSTFNFETPMLCYADNPEDKRKIIGDTFINVTNDFLREIRVDPEDIILCQGTLRPDLIESASSMVSSNAATIKTHHNDTELVRKLRSTGRVVEPLKDFHKDEVRALGYDLGLPAHLVERHPFPGPGLAIRILCAEEPYIEKDFSETQVIARVITDYDNKVKKNHALLNRVSTATSKEEQAELVRISSSCKIFATILPIRSVGVQGDGRSYSYVLGLSTETNPNWEDMLFLARLIPRILHNINRVCYIFGGPVKYQINDITHTHLNRYALSQLRQADHLANEILQQSGCCRKISQLPVILIPVHFDRDPASRIPSCSRSVVLRPFKTSDFMTGLPAVPGSDEMPLPVLEKIVTEIKAVQGVSRVLYDLTAKPPGTTEWE